MLTLRGSVSTDVIKFHELLSKLLLCSLIDHSLVLNGHLHSLNVFSQCLQSWEFVSLSRERVTNSLDLISGVSSVVECNDIHRSWVSVLNIILVMVVFGVHERFTLGSSENKSSKSLNLFSFDHSSNSLDVDGLVSNQILFFLGNLVLDISLSLLVQLRDHVLGGSEHDVAVFQTVEGGLSFLKSDVLLLDELLLLVDILLDFFQENVDSLSFVVLNLLQLVLEAFNVFGWANIDEVFLALVVEVMQFPLTFFARLHLSCVWQGVRCLISVQVKELGMPDVSKGVHDVPVVILWNGQLIQLHYFRSR